MVTLTVLSNLWVQYESCSQRLRSAIPSNIPVVGQFAVVTKSLKPGPRRSKSLDFSANQYDCLTAWDESGEARLGV